MKEYLKSLGFIVAVMVLIFGAIYFDFSIWRLQHPQAPSWTYLFK